MFKKYRRILVLAFAVAFCAGMLPVMAMTAKAADTETFTITFSPGEGTGSDCVTDELPIGDTTTTVLSFEESSALGELFGSGWTAPAGKTFAYWIANDMNLTHFNPGDQIPNDGTITVLTAIYTGEPEVNTITLTYMTGEGTGDDFVSDPIEMNSTVPFPALTFDAVSTASSILRGGSGWTAPDGRSFLYWVANDMNLTHYNPGDNIPTDGSVTSLVAVYGAPTATITYISGEGTGDDFVSDEFGTDSGEVSQTLSFDEVSTASSGLRGGSVWAAPAGRLFLYWLSNDMNLTHYNPGDNIPMDGSVTMLAAIYGTPTAALTYKAGEGSDSDASTDPFEVSSTAASTAFTFGDASQQSVANGGSSWKVPSGKTFAYWIADDENATHYNAGDAIPNDGSVTTLTAYYTEQGSKGMLKVANKELTGAELTDGQFSFTVTPLICSATGDNGYYTLGSSEDSYTVTNDAAGSVLIDQDAVFTQEFCDKYCFDYTGSGNIYNGLYAFLIQEVNKGADGYTYDGNSYVITVAYSEGKMIGVDAFKYTVDDAGHYIFHDDTDLLYTDSDNEVVMGYNAEKGYVTFDNTYTKKSADNTGTSGTTVTSTSTSTATVTVEGAAAPCAAASCTAASPKTGDQNNAGLWIILMGACAAGIVAVLRRKSLRNR